MPFKLISQDLDIKLIVSGKTLQDLFKSALRSVVFCLKPEILKLHKKNLQEKQKIKIEAADINSLLIEFLSKILVQVDVGSTVFADISFAVFGENFLEGEMAGVKADDFKQEIKAVSYEEIDIKRSPISGLYETVLVFDV